MRKTTTLFLALMVAAFAFGKSVTMEQANQVANKYVTATSLKASRSVANSFSKSYNGITTYYVFNYTGGGFVVVSADDAATPILAQSDEGFIETEVTNPELRYWLENYSTEIADIAATKAVNTESLSQWNKILNNDIKAPSADVAPLLGLITWDQKQYYNYYCPAVTSGGSAGKAWVGCVATTMGQIMKYYNFPATGVGSYSYSHGVYGTQSANFGATTYDYINMGNTATFSKYKPIATLLYHAGVAVNMNYGGSGSGASNSSVPLGFSKYFNYDNSTITLAYMSDYSAADWKALLISELDAKRPMYYSGTDAVTDPANPEGHAWVCDGYQTSGGTTLFHMNWGWSASGNGYYAIGALSTSNNNGVYNSGNAIVYGIKPGNPNLIVRFDELDETNSVPKGPAFNIKYSVVKGTPTAVKLYIDDVLMSTTAQTTFSYSWNTSEVNLGVHKVRVEATDGTNTVYWEVNIGLSEWVPEASGFSTPSRGINYIHAVNANVVWATAIDGRSGSTAINEFTKTINGGTTWTPGQVLGGKVYGLGNICGINENIAFVSLYNKDAAQDNTCGVYKTSNGGTTWTHLVGALQGASSFADNVWFWDENNGMCHGDVTGTGTTAYFEIYTTTNSGTTWTRVPKANIGGGVDALSGEGGWTSVIQAVGTNTIMFGTNKGNLYISHDRGLHWTISNTGISPTSQGGINKISFKDDLNGLVAQTSETLVLKETHDGGSTWQTLNPTGPFNTSDMVYVPGTDNTWVSVGYGASYSFDGGHSWAPFPGTQTDQYLSVGFTNNHCGWAGTFNTDATVKGMYKYSGILEVLSPITNLTAQPGVNNVQLSWTQPVTAPLSYNVYCNDILITNTTSLEYLDIPLTGGSLNYCVTAVYALGESPKTCATAEIILGLANTDQAAYRIYPNPSSDIINVVSPAKFNEVRMINSLGKVVYKNNTKGTNLRILTAGMEPGMYILQIYSGTQIISKKVSIIR
jgi:hypothetical protein